MKNFLVRLLGAAQKFKLLDYGVFKIVLIFAGILLGSYFAKFFMNYITIVWCVFIITYIWIIYKVFFKYFKK